MKTWKVTTACMHKTMRRGCLCALVGVTTACMHKTMRRGCLCALVGKK